MRTIKLLAVCLFFSTLRLSAQVAPADTSKYYNFHINYWFNTHHFLWLEAFMNLEKDSTLVTEELSKKDREIWNEAVNYYKENLVEKDLRTDDYMDSYKKWVINQEEELQKIPEQFSEHMNKLQQVSPVYKKYFWPTHLKSCQKVLNDNLAIIRAIESDYVDQITTLTRQFWEFEKIRVDLTFVAKADKWNIRNRPYTSLFPTHVVMNAMGENAVPGNWIELLFHESAHHLILPNHYFVGGTINDYVEADEVRPPRQLWHAYLFYFTGQVTKQLLNAHGVDYEITYMERYGVFSRYFPLFEQHLKPYLKREVTLTQATEMFVKALNAK